MSQPVIELRGIVNRFGAQVVHDGLDMQVMDGEVFGIVGGSGTGKSVLLRTILGLQRPRSGRVILYGRDISSLSESELREVKRHYGVTFQRGALFTSLNVTQNVQMPMTEFFDLDEEALDALARLKLNMRSHIEALTVAGPAARGFGSVPASPACAVAQVPNGRHKAE